MAKPKKKKKSTPNWRDSTYQKQISYYNKLLADFKAQQTRQKAEVGTYYGTEANPGTKVQKMKRVMVPTGKKTKKGKKVMRRSWKPETKTSWKRVQVPKGHSKTKKRWSRKKVVSKVMTTKGKKAATEGLYQKELKESRARDIVDIADDYAARGMIHSGLYAQKRGDYEKEFGKQMAETNRQKSKKYGDLASEYKQYLREQELNREEAQLGAIRRRAARSGSFL